MGLKLCGDIGTIVGPADTGMDYYVVRLDVPALDESDTRLSEIVWLDDNLELI